ncbi:MAG: AbrB/MazE/SpoVT family DNA-binding domain-containing protein [Moorellales bacterium]
MKSVVKVSSKGQIVLPVAVRERAGIEKGDALAAYVVGGKVVLEPLKREVESWPEILRDTSGIWPDVDPDYVVKLRREARVRLEEKL